MAEFVLSKESKFIIFTAVLASLLEIIDTSIVNVAIPTMMGNLGATLEDISWVVTGYIIANAIVLPVSAWAGAQIGRRKYYIGCILLFTATSVACGLAPNLETLVVFRILQGLAGGALLPTSQALIQEQFPREKAGTASAIYGMSVMIGPTLGPTLGGYLTDTFGWRSIFNINLPLGLFAAFMAFAYVRNSQAEVGGAIPVLAPAPVKRTSIDSVGLALLCAGIGTLQFALERGEADGWFDSGPIVICMLVAAITLPLFVWWELRVENPIVNVRLFKNAVVRSGTWLMTMVGFMLFGLVFILPVFMATLLHLDATQIGMMFIPGSLVTMMCMPIIGNLLRKIDARVLILWGIVTITVMFLMMIQFSPQTSREDIFWSLMVRGLAMGFLFVPINAVVLGQFRGAELGQVAGLMNLSRQTGGSIGIALIGTLLDRNTKQNYQDLMSHVSVLNPSTQAAIPTGTNLMHIPEGILRSIQARVDQQVFVMSFTQMMWVLMIAFILTLIPLMSLKAPPKVTGPIDVH